MRSRRDVGSAQTLGGAASCIAPRAALLRLAVGLVVMLGMVAGSVLPGRGAWGQDDWDAGKKAARQPNEGMMGMQVMAPADFDRWVSNGKSTDQMRRTLESLLTLQVDSAARTCGLSDIQKKNLELAGYGDVKRLTRSVEELKEKFRGVGQDQKKFNDIAQEVSLLQTKMNSGVFGESSLYRKTLNETLDRDQAARYEQADLERRRFRYEAKIEVFLSNLETTLPLRAEQRQQLVKLLLAETKPPKKFGQMDHYIVMYQIRTLGEAKLKPLFDDAQWQTLKRILDASRGIEQHLRLNGFLP